MKKTYNGKVKREIQSYFYNKSKVRGNVVCLVGSSFDKHIKDINIIIKNTRSKAYCYDIDKDVINTFKHLQSDKVKLIHGNIAGARIERFMDIDLMASLLKTGNTIEYLFKEQVYKYTKTSYNQNYHKTFMFTASRRGPGAGNHLIHQFTKNLITKLDLDWTMLDVEIKHYYDTSIMSTVQINWK